MGGPEAGRGIGVLLLVHDLLIGFLHDLEHLLRLVFVRVIDVGVRMVLPGELPVCFFDLFIARVSGDAEHFVRV